MKLSYKDASFIEKTAADLIKSYQDSTGKIYNYLSVKSVTDVVDFLNGKIIFSNIKEKFDIIEMLYLENENKFTIILDESTKNKGLFKNGCRENILRMLWMYIDYRISNNNWLDNTVIYPENSNIDENEIRELLDKNVKKYIKK